DRELTGARGEEPVDKRLVHLDGQQAVLESVPTEDISEGRRGADVRRDHGAEAMLRDCPDSVLAAGAAAKILARHQHSGSACLGCVEREGGIRLPAFVADILEEKL